MPMAAYLKLIEDAGYQAITPLAAEAMPSGPVSAHAYRQLTETILEAVDKGCEAVMLDLHGAMVTNSLEDGEGELLARLRDQVGPDIPIVASLDMHANITPEMVLYSDALTVFRTYPHLDMAETGARAFTALQFLLDGGKFYKKMCRTTKTTLLDSYY